MHLKAVNNAQIPIMDQLVAANLSLTLAQAYAANARGSLDSVLGQQASVELKDLQNWFSVNWETSIDVPEVDEHGKPTGKTKKMTGKEIQSYLLGLSTASAGQDLPANWFNIRSQKNQFGYSMVKTVLARPPPLVLLVAVGLLVFLLILSKLRLLLIVMVSLLVEQVFVVLTCLVDNFSKKCRIFVFCKIVLTFAIHNCSTLKPFLL